MQMSTDRPDRSAQVVPFLVPTSAPEAEHAVLGALLTDSEAWALLAPVGLTGADFTDEANRLIWAAIVRVQAAGQVPDLLTVHEDLRAAGHIDLCGGLKYINEICQATLNTRRVAVHAGILKDKTARRQLEAMGKAVQHLAQSPKAGPDHAAEVAALAGQIQSITAAAGPDGSGLPLMTLAQLAEKAGQLKWLVKGAVPLESIGVMFGASGAFKSFVAIDLALHVAHGMPWMGRKTKQAPVIIIAAEGGAGLWRRVEAWHRERGIAWQDAPVYVIPMSVDLTTDCSRVIEAAKALGVVPGLMVIDTLSQTFSGEENSATEVAAYLRELGLWFREAWLCSVLVIHHSGHNAAERPRGSSALRANVDYMLGVHRDEKEMIATVSCHKQKDGEAFEDVTFGLSVFELGQDDDGDPITALVATAVSSEEAKAELVQHEAARGRSGRNALIIDLAEDGMEDAALRKAFYEDCGVADAEARRQAYYRALGWATKHRLLEIVEHRVILAKVVRDDKDRRGA